MNIKKPNFFILGAPKCGTTSLYEWLKSHPDIFLPEVKEPYYFNTDRINPSRMSLREYEALFEEAGGVIAVGEATPGYLYSREAVANILRYNPEAMFIVMVRNPVEMAYSLHHFRCFVQSESETDFETAWNLQTERNTGGQLAHIPAGVNDFFCGKTRIYLYGRVCGLGQQLQRLYQQVPRKRVHIVVFDDLVENPGREYRAVLNFLNVPDDCRRIFQKHNPAKVLHSAFLSRVIRLLAHPNLVKSLKNALMIRKKLGILSWIQARNEKVQPRPPLSPHMRRALTDYFEEDIRLLERLLERDLSHWKQ